MVEQDGTFYFRVDCRNRTEILREAKNFRKATRILIAEHYNVSMPMGSRKSDMRSAVMDHKRAGDCG